jgi:hypothetical protein
MSMNPPQVLTVPASTPQLSDFEQDPRMEAARFAMLAAAARGDFRQAARCFSLRAALLRAQERNA